MRTKSYRATMILDTRNYQDSIDTLVDNIKTKIAEAGATIMNVINKGQIKFRRITDRKFPAGLYLEIMFQAPGEVLEVIRSKFSLDSTVNRVFIEKSNGLLQ